MRRHIDLNELIEAIRNLPGQKILTLSLMEDHQVMTIDVSETGVFGYQPGHWAMFAAKLARAITTGGTLIIRQFLESKVETTVPSGKRMQIPEKNLYGISLGDGEWRAVPRDELMEAHLTDHKTGDELSPEPGVIYCDFPSQGRT